MKVVVDAGVAAKWYADEDDSERAAVLLGSKYKLCAPQLMLSEFVSIMWKKNLVGDMDEVAGTEKSQGISESSYKVLFARSAGRTCLERSVEVCSFGL